MTIREQAKLKYNPVQIIAELNIYNDTDLSGEIRLTDKYKYIHFRQEFSTRLMRKNLNDFLLKSYSDKINNRGWVISIIIY